MRQTLVILSALLIVGCDAQYGVVRKAEVPDFVDYKCIEQSLESIQEVSRVKYTFMGGNPDMTENMRDAYARHRYHYTVDNINSFVSVLTNNKGTEVALFTTKNRRPPSQKAVNTIRPVMDKVQVAISDHCKIENFTSLVTETCTKVQCP